MLKKSLLVLVLLSSALPNIKAAGFTAAGAQDRIIIAFQPGASASDQRKIAEAQGLTVIGEIPELRVLLVQAQPGRTRLAFASLSANPKVFRAGQDVWTNWLKSEPVSFAQTPMPSFESVFHALPKLQPRQISADPNGAAVSAEVQWGVARLNAPAAWPTNQGAGVKVAVVDTGIDPTHQELKVAGGYNAINKGSSWADDHSHGTHVAGIIAASFDNKGVVGVAPKATLYAVKVLTKDGGGSLFSIMDGINWCAKNGIQVMNMSLGAPQEMPLLQYALQSAVAAGVTIIAAAGNDGKSVNWPAAYPESIAVSALCPPNVTETRLCPSAQEGIATFSSRGPEVAFIAPGVNIPSTVPVSSDPSGVHSYSGTSMATPHVAGLAALAVARGARGSDAVRAALKAAARPLPGLSGDEQGNGLVDAARLK